MKILKNILAFIIILFLAVVYMIDRVILVLLPWVEVRPLQEWLPKSTEQTEVKKEFPSLTDEAIDELVTLRKFMNKMIRSSFVRVFITTFIAMCVYVILM
jgi:hypothetical protein